MTSMERESTNEKMLAEPLARKKRSRTGSS
jgi:hypothetical protein